MTVSPWHTNAMSFSLLYFKQSIGFLILSNGECSPAGMEAPSRVLAGPSNVTVKRFQQRWIDSERQGLVHTTQLRNGLGTGVFLLKILQATL